MVVEKKIVDSVGFNFDVPMPWLNRQILFRPPTLTSDILQPLDQNECLVPYLKDLIYTCLDVEAQGHGKTFMVYNVGLKYPKSTI